MGRRHGSAVAGAEMTAGQATGIVRLEALGYRCLRFLRCSLNNFQLLVGPNGSGKSTFLDVPAFLADLVTAGPVAAVEGNAKFAIRQRAPDAKHLTWMRQGGPLEMAVEMAIPQDLLKRLGYPNVELCRYEIAIDVSGPCRLKAENLFLTPAPQPAPVQKSLFPQPPPGESIVLAPRKHSREGWRIVIRRAEEPERVYFSKETSEWVYPFRVAADKAGLASLPEDEEQFPVAVWFRRFLAEGVQRVMLSSEAMRMPSPPGRPKDHLLADGSNLPWVVHKLEKEHPEKLAEWEAHIREALPDVESVTTQERPEDRHRYLTLHLKNGLSIPSWLISDGTLRLLALTLLAYVPGLSGIYLIEEPENGLHPRAVEIAYQSLSSVYGAQVLVATHSPVMISLVESEKILCFARDESGATDVVAGNEHPRLREWLGKADLGTLFAGGVLE